MIELLNYKIILVFVAFFIIILFENILPNEIIKFKKKLKELSKIYFFGQ